MGGLLRFSPFFLKNYVFSFPQATSCRRLRIGLITGDKFMTKVDHARLVQALQDTSTLVAHNIGPEKHTLAAKKLQNSIAQLLGELNKDWLEVMAQQSAKPSVGIPD
jgi:hypothetical protein